MKALIIVDVQNDFFPGGALPVQDANAVLLVIDKLLQVPFDLVIATKDWHPSDHKSFASQHNKKPGEQINLKGLNQILWPDHCVQGSKGAEFASGWHSERVRHVFHKGTDKYVDSYSAFFDNGHLISTGLSEFLKKCGVNEIYILGLATDYCVKYSALDALKEGFKVHVVADGCRGVNLQPGDDQRALQEVQAKGAKVVDSLSIYGGFNPFKRHSSN